MNKEEKFIELWEEEKQKGKLKYILKISIRNTAMIVAGTILVRNIFFVETPFLFKADDLYTLISLFIVILIVSIIGSNYNWKNNESKYNNIKYSKN